MYEKAAALPLRLQQGMADHRPRPPLQLAMPALRQIQHQRLPQRRLLGRDSPAQQLRCLRQSARLRLHLGPPAPGSRTIDESPDENEEKRISQVLRSAAQEDRAQCAVGRTMCSGARAGRGMEGGEKGWGTSSLSFTMRCLWLLSLRSVDQSLLCQKKKKMGSPASLLQSHLANSLA